MLQPQKIVIGVEAGISNPHRLFDVARLMGLH